MRSASFVPHMNHVSVSPTNGNGPTRRQRKILTRVGNHHPGQSFFLVRVFLCLRVAGPIFISRANAHMVHMG